MILRNIIFTIVALLLTTSFGMAGSTPGFFEFIDAVDRGDIKTVKVMINSGADVKKKLRSGGTSLMLASANGHTNMVRLLIKNGAELNSTNSKGDTALTLASAFGHVEAVKALIDGGADLNLKNHIGTPMKIASLNGHMGVVRLFMDYRAN